MEQALQYLLSYLGDSIYKIELSEEKDIFFVELNDNTTIDEISKKIASIKDVEIINGLVLKQPFEALGLDADESKRRGKQTMKIKSNINTFEGGATLSDKFNVPIWQEGLYYLKLNNLIRDGFNKTMKIKGYFQEGIRVIENTDFPLADKKTIDIPFNILFDFIDSGRFKIGNVVYENERDKMLLENEINSIKELFKMANTEAEKAQLAIELANTEAEKAQLETSYKDHILSMEKSTEKIKQDFSDTLGGMEAMASGMLINKEYSSARLNWIFSTPEDRVTFLNLNGYSDKFSRVKFENLTPKLQSLIFKKWDSTIPIRNKEEGGRIENQYEGKTWMQVWDSWTKKQKKHFLEDHFGGIPIGDYNEIVNKDSWHLTISMKNELEKHVSEEQYAGGSMVEGGEMDDRMYNFLKDDLKELEKAVSEGNNEEVERFFSYWGYHLKSLKTKTNDRMYNFLKDDLKELEKAVSEGNNEEVKRFFSYWGYHLKSLKLEQGGSMATGGKVPSLLDKTNLVHPGERQAEEFNVNLFLRTGKVTVPDEKADKYVKFLSQNGEKVKTESIKHATLKGITITKISEPIRNKEEGGRIENQYEGKTWMQVWDSWTKKQKKHFLEDHFGGIPIGDYNEIVNKDSWHLTIAVKNQLEKHVSEEQYAGGSMAGGGEMATGGRFIEKLNDYTLKQVQDAYFTNTTSFSSDKDINLKLLNFEKQRQLSNLKKGVISQERYDKILDWIEAEEKRQTNSSDVVKIKSSGGSMAKGGKVQPKDEYTDILYGGFYIVTDIKKHPVHGDIVILKDRNTGDEIQKKYEDMLKISGNKQDHNNPNFQFLRTGKKGTLNEESIEKTRQERLELQFKEDPEHAYHRTGTYYPIKGVHYAKGGSMAEGGNLAVANEIRKQVGHKALFMLGAKDLAGDEHSFSFKIRGSKKWKHIKIFHNGKDLYDITFTTWYGNKIKNKVVNDVYNDNLHKVIEEETGLYTKLAKGGLMATGGEIPNNYEGKSAEQVWNDLTFDQRTHFLSDHHLSPRIKKEKYTATQYTDLAGFEFNRMPASIKEEFIIHVESGQYAKGGKSKGKKADFSVKKLTKKDKFWHARIKSPKGAKTCKVPDWAETIASATYEGAKVTTCKFGDEWHLQKVMIPTNGIGKKEAKLISEQIVSKINKK